MPHASAHTVVSTSQSITLIFVGAFVDRLDRRCTPDTETSQERIVGGGLGPGAGWLHQLSSLQALAAGTPGDRSGPGPEAQAEGSKTPRLTSIRQPPRSSGTYPDTHFYPFRSRRGH